MEQARAYSISLSPSLIPSTGPLIDALVSSGVARYGGFRLIERVYVYDPSGTVKPVPGSKEDVFKNKEISLLDKRRLMRFLMFAAGEFEDKKELEGQTETPFPEYLKAVFSLNDEMTNAIAYALAYCLSPSGPCNSPLPLKLFLIQFRPHLACPPPPAAIPPLRRPLRNLPLPRRTLRELRRDCSRLLPHSRSQRRSLHPRQGHIEPLFFFLTLSAQAYPPSRGLSRPAQLLAPHLLPILFLTLCNSHTRAAPALVFRAVLRLFVKLYCRALHRHHRLPSLSRCPRDPVYR